MKLSENLSYQLLCKLLTNADEISILVMDDFKQAIFVARHNQVIT